MGVLGKWTDRVLAWVGLDIERDFEMHTEHFTRIDEGLYLGARPGPEHVEVLRAAGVTHVVSCLDAQELPKMAFLEQDFQTLRLAIHDGIHQDIAALFPAFFEFADNAQGGQSGAKLYVHCEVGVSRSATMVIALLMRRERGTFLDTLLKVRALRPQILPNIGFASQLQRLEHAHRPPTQTQGELSSLAHYLRRVCKAPVEAELLQSMLETYDYNAPAAIEAIFGDDVPRVIQGVRL